MIPIKFQEKLPPYWYENDVAAHFFEGAGDEANYQAEKVADLGRQFVLPYATYSLDIWEWIYFGNVRFGQPKERREGIRKKNLTKAKFSLASLREIGRNVGKLERITENFSNKEILLEYSGNEPVHFDKIADSLEQIRPVHVKRLQPLVKHLCGTVIISTVSRHFEVDYFICGSFYVEDDLEGRLFHEALSIAEGIRSHAVDYPLTNTFYPFPELEV